MEPDDFTKQFKSKVIKNPQLPIQLAFLDAQT